MPVLPDNFSKLTVPPSPTRHPPPRTPTTTAPQTQHAAHTHPPAAGHRDPAQRTPPRLARLGTRRQTPGQNPKPAHPTRRVARLGFIHRTGTGTYALDTPPRTDLLTTSPTSPPPTAPRKPPLATATTNRTRRNTPNPAKTNHLTPRPAPSTPTTTREATHPPPPGHDHQTANSAALIAERRR
jgi:hypothetical protein